MVAITIGLWGCEEPARGPSCPERTSREPERLQRLQQRLAADPTSNALVIATRGRYVACFGEGIEPGVDPQHRVRLDSAQDDARLAAKLAHLLMHVSRGLPFEDDAARPCAERLALAREREQRAHALESSLLRGFGLPPLDGAELERVMAGYRSRCEQTDPSDQEVTPSQD